MIRRQPIEWQRVEKVAQPTNQPARKMGLVSGRTRLKHQSSRASVLEHRLRPGMANRARVSKVANLGNEVNRGNVASRHLAIALGIALAIAKARRKLHRQRTRRVRDSNLGNKEQRKVRRPGITASEVDLREGMGRGEGTAQNSQNQQNQQNGRSGQGNFFEQWAAGNNEGRGNRGGAFEGPITGADYSRWSDRLRDIEEVLQDPQLRTDVARVREQARTMRTEFKRHSEPPKWELVDAEVIKPLRILQSRVAEQLARQSSREAVVPIDRDPVPQKYADAVSRYYERLGKD